MRFRFTIRDLLWLTALVAIGTGWWLDHRAHLYVPYVRHANDGIYTFIKPPFNAPAENHEK